MDRDVKQVAKPSFEFSCSVTLISSTAYCRSAHWRSYKCIANLIERLEPKTKGGGFSRLLFWILVEKSLLVVLMLSASRQLTGDRVSDLVTFLFRVEKVSP